MNYMEYKVAAQYWAQAIYLYDNVYEEHFYRKKDISQFVLLKIIQGLLFHKKIHIRK